MQILTSPLKRFVRHFRFWLAGTLWKMDASKTYPEASRTGWPPLSGEPPMKRRMGETRPWLAKGPRDDWKR